MLANVLVLRCYISLKKILSLIEHFYIAGPVKGWLQTWGNGSWEQVFPWGGGITALAISSNPLLESTLPTQAHLLPMPHRYHLTAGYNTHNNILTTSYGVLGDHRRQERVVETVLLVSFFLLT